MWNPCQYVKYNDFFFKQAHHQFYLLLLMFICQLITRSKEQRHHVHITFLLFPILSFFFHSNFISICEKNPSFPLLIGNFNFNPSNIYISMFSSTAFFFSPLHVFPQHVGPVSDLWVRKSTT